MKSGEAKFVGEEGIVEVSNGRGTVLMRKNHAVEIKDRFTRPLLWAALPGKQKMAGSYGRHRFQ